MDDASSLSLEILAPERPDGSAQTLWYWNSLTRDVEPAPATSELHLLLVGGNSVAIGAADTSAPPPVVLAEMVGTVGDNHHSLVNYAMPYDGTQPAGLYGFFARLTSDSYASSESYLTVFNLNGPHDDMGPASSAIWGAAMPGDYNRDGFIDAADYTVWAAAYGDPVEMAYLGADGNGDGAVDAADYTVWRNHVTIEAFAVPEAATAKLLLAAMLTAPLRQAQRRTY